MGMADKLEAELGNKGNRARRQRGHNGIESFIAQDTAMSMQVTDQISFLG
jgi:hypothetical protein